QAPVRETPRDEAIDEMRVTVSINTSFVLQLNSFTNLNSRSRLTPELTRPAHEAFNIMGQFNDESEAIAGSGSMSC
ncbi:MAG TPA: hypothetical protein VE732_03135, partial [Nitrososphaera sp.]|nr:hypothetical protein [Nitrososphaera sp.]